MRTADQNRRALIAYDAAYTVLPGRAHAGPEELHADFGDAPDLAALDLYRRAARGRVTEPDPDDLRAIRGHVGRLDAERDVLVIDYPTYPAIDLLAAPHGLPPDAGVYVLAPYFSAVVIDRDTREVNCFVLGQSANAKTTLREVSPAMNANLGPGCEPELGAFLELLRKRIRR